MKTLIRIWKMYSIKKEIDTVTSEMAQLEYYSGIEKNDDPKIALRYELLDQKREILIRRLAFV